MQELEWMETFELGVPEVDGDHRAMLDLMKAVKSAAGTGDRKRCESHVDRLLIFAQWHFKREEAFLKRHGYTGLADHTQYHDQLLQRAKAVGRACKAVETKEEYAKCCEELMSFLIDDVVRGDMQLKSFFQSAGLSLTYRNHRTDT